MPATLKNAKYIAYESSSSKLGYFETYEEAEKWLKDISVCEQEISKGVLKGENFIAKVTHRAKYQITDEKSNYHKHTDECAKDCDKEEWPYSDEFDTVGDITIKEIK